MTRRLLGLVLLPASLMMVATAGSAHGATCSDLLDIEVHGQHVVDDYVLGPDLDTPWPPAEIGQRIAGAGAAVPGGPGPRAHFVGGVAPGASFCNDQARSPGRHW